MHRPLFKTLSRTNYDEGIINTMENITRKSGFKNLTKTYTTIIANQILCSYISIDNLKIDRYIRYNKESSDPFNKIEVRSSIPDNALEENWTKKNRRYAFTYKTR